MKKNGFTLIELTIAFAVISIIATIVISSLSAGRKKARDVHRIADISQVKIALEQYYNISKRYPNPGPTGYCGLASQLSKYLAAIPRDPEDTGTSCSAASRYEYYANSALQPQEWMLRTFYFELPASMGPAFADDLDGNSIAPSGGVWYGGLDTSATFNCPGGVCPNAIQCGTVPENTTTNAVYCIRSQ